MKTLLITAAFFFSFQFAHTQNFTMADNSGELVVSKKVDTTPQAINDLRSKVLKALKLPDSPPQGQTIVDVQINEEGKITDFNIVKSLGVEIDGCIARALKEVSQIRAIQIGDVKKTQVIRLPITIKS